MSDRFNLRITSSGNRQVFIEVMAPGNKGQIAKALIYLPDIDIQGEGEVYINTPEVIRWLKESKGQERE